MHAPVEPSISRAAFSCPHCGAYTTQYWHEIRVSELGREYPTPSLIGERDLHHFSSHAEMPEDMRQEMITWAKKHMSGIVFFEDSKQLILTEKAQNLHLSKCHHCSKITIWVRDRMVHPISKAAIQPNPDLPDEIKHDFEEAREIVNASPRGAAALLRLCLQKLCTHILGSESTDINRDIGLLVQRGLNPTIQQALDVVRVIGNESVHPGELNLKDDRDTALALFGLINAAANQLITHPKEVSALYSTLPPAKLQGIDARDKTSKQQPTS